MIPGSIPSTPYCAYPDSPPIAAPLSPPISIPASIPIPIPSRPGINKQTTAATISITRHISFQCSLHQSPTFFKPSQNFSQPDFSHSGFR